MAPPCPQIHSLCVYPGSLRRSHARFWHLAGLRQLRSTTRWGLCLPAINHFDQVDELFFPNLLVYGQGYHVAMQSGAARPAPGRKGRVDALPEWTCLDAVPEEVTHEQSSVTDHDRERERTGRCGYGKNQRPQRIA